MSEHPKPVGIGIPGHFISFSLCVIYSIILPIKHKIIRTTAPALGIAVNVADGAAFLVVCKDKMVINGYL